MSIRTLLRWSLALLADTPAHRLCLVALVANAASDGTVTMPQNDLAAAIGVNARHARKLVADWETRGALRRLGSTQDGTTYAIIGAGQAGDEKEDDHPEALQRVQQSPSPGAVPQNRGEVLQNGGGRFYRTAPLSTLSTSVHNSTLRLEDSAGTTVLRSTVSKSGTNGFHHPAASTPQPQPLMNGARLDLVGLPLGDDPDQLLRTAIETWQTWQAQLPGRKRRQIAPTGPRSTKFLRLWRTVLHHNMTRWRQVCQACTRSAILAGAAGNWDGASFDWVLRDDHCERILGGQYLADYDPQPEPERVCA
jgi:hypothetical protein